MATTVSHELIDAAIYGFEKQIADLTARITELKHMKTGKSVAAKPTAVIAVVPKKRKVRKLSAAGRKAISEAAKRRWAERRANDAKKLKAAKKA